MRFLFKTDTFLKPYNEKKWYIDYNYINNQYISAANIKQAIDEYQKILLDEYYITISKTAIKTKSPIYVDDENGHPIQLGYTFTASMDFYDDNYKVVKNYLDLWTTIETVVPTQFK